MTISVSTRVWRRALFAMVVSINEPGRMADMVASHLECKLEDKQTLLEVLGSEGTT